MLFRSPAVFFCVLYFDFPKDFVYSIAATQENVDALSQLPFLARRPFSMNALPRAALCKANRHEIRAEFVRGFEYF